MGNALQLVASFGRRESICEGHVLGPPFEVVQLGFEVAQGQNRLSPVRYQRVDKTSTQALSDCMVSGSRKRPVGLTCVGTSTRSTSRWPHRSRPKHLNASGDCMPSKVVFVADHLRNESKCGKHARVPSLRACTVGLVRCC